MHSVLESREKALLERQRQLQLRISRLKEEVTPAVEEELLEDRGYTDAAPPAGSLELLEAAALSSPSPAAARQEVPWLYARLGQVGLLRAAVHDKTALSCRDSRGNSVLHVAARSGQAETVVMLCEEGADAAETNDAGERPLHSAVIGGSIAACRALLEAGVDPRLTDGNGQTAAALAARMGKQRVLALLQSWLKLWEDNSVAALEAGAAIVAGEAELPAKPAADASAPVSDTLLRNLRLKEAAWGTSSERLLPILLSISRALCAEGKARAGERHLLRRVAIARAACGEASAESASALAELGWLYYTVNLPVRAVTQLSAALKLARPLSGDAMTIVPLLRNLALSCLATGDAARACTLLQEALSAVEHVHGLTSLRVCPLLLPLATVYATMSAFSNEEACLRRIIAINSGLDGWRARLQASDLLAACLFRQQKLDAAQRMFQRVLETATELMVDGADKEATLFRAQNNLAVVACEQTRLREERAKTMASAKAKGKKKKEGEEEEEEKEREERETVIEVPSVTVDDDDVDAVDDAVDDAVPSKPTTKKKTMMSSSKSKGSMKKRMRGSSSKRRIHPM